MQQSPSPFGRGAYDRRSVVKFLGVGAVSAASIPLLAARTGTAFGGGSASTGSATFGSAASDPVPKKAYAAFVKAFETKSKDTVTTNTTDHNSFQEKISTYLQGSPDDAFTWFAGYRMRYFAKKGLLGDISDVWDKVGSNYSAALKTASTGDDGKQYFVPNYNYPWGFFYRKSVWQSKGYTVPTKWVDFVKLLKQMKGDGIFPIAFADKDGWPAMGTFDYLNMHINGYQFHLDLCAHKESWNTAKVKKVFDTWNEIRSYQDPSALGLTWQAAAQKLANKQAGMYLLGSFVTQQFTDATVLADIGFFEFPEIDVEGQTALEAPIDGLCLSKKGASNPFAKDLFAFLGLIGTPLGLLLAVVLDQKLRGSRIYQTVFFLPVMFSLALIGIIWQLFYSQDDGLLNNVLGTANTAHAVDWFGNSSVKLRPYATTAKYGYFSFTGPFNLDNFVMAWTQGGFIKYFGNSLIFTVPTVLITLFLASLMAFAVSRYSWKFNLTLLIMFTAGNLLPPQVLATPLFEAFRLIQLPYWMSDSGSLLNTYASVIAVNTAFQIGFCTFVLSNFMKAIPVEISEAAKVDGVGVWRHYWSIVLPLTRPALAALGTLEVIFIYNDFFWPLIFIQSGDRLPVTTALNNLKGEWLTNYNLLAAGAMITVIPTLVIYLVLQRQFVAGLTLGASKG